MEIGLEVCVFEKSDWGIQLQAEEGDEEARHDELGGERNDREHFRLQRLQQERRANPPETLLVADGGVEGRQEDAAQVSHIILVTIHNVGRVLCASNDFKEKASPDFSSEAWMSLL